MRPLAQDDLTNRSFSHITFTLFLDEGGSSREISLNHTLNHNIADGSAFVADMWDPSTRAHMCKVVELEQLYGWKCSPPHTYSFHMYTIDQYLAHKLRNACRRLTGGCFAMTPLNDFLLFKEFICVIKEQIRKCLHLMPEIRQEYFLNPPLLPDVVLLPHELPPAPQSDLTIQTKNIALFQCPSCPSRFECENLLNSHATFHEQHAKEKFICFVCETIFTCSAALKKHATSKKHQTNMKYVKSNNSYTCGTCGKCITLLQNLRTHELHHLGVNFKRRFCSETFRTRNKVRKHETENHGSLPRYVCSSCAEQFIKYKDFSAHVKTHTATNSKEVIKATRNKPIITSGESINDLVPASGQDKSCAQPGGKKPNSKSKSIVLWTTPLHITPNIKASGLSRKCAVKPLHQNNVRKPDKK